MKVSQMLVYDSSHIAQPRHNIASVKITHLCLMLATLAVYIGYKH